MEEVSSEALHCIHLAFSSHFLLTSISSPQFSVWTWAGSKLCPTASLPVSPSWRVLISDWNRLMHPAGQKHHVHQELHFLYVGKHSGKPDKAPKHEYGRKQDICQPQWGILQVSESSGQNKMSFSIPEKNKKIYTFLARFFIFYFYDWMKDRIWYFLKLFSAVLKPSKKVIILLQ